MWEIIHKKIWQEEYKKEESKGMKANGNHIAKFASKPNNKPQPVDALTPAYGVLIYDKLRDTLSSQLTVLRQKAVRTFCEMYQQKKEHIVRSVQAGVIPALIKVYDDEDLDVKRHALLATARIASLTYGREAILAIDDYATTLTSIIEKSDDATVKANAFQIMTQMKSVKGFGFLGKCMSCIIQAIDITDEKEAMGEKTAIHVQALDALRLSLMAPENHEQAHTLNVTSKLAKFLSIIRAQSHQDVLQALGRVCAKLCFRPKGIEEGVKWKLIQQWVPILHDGPTILHGSTSQVLMFLTLNVEGKRQAMQAGLTGTLIKRVEEKPTQEVMINILKIASAISELPEAREALQPLAQHLNIEALTTQEKSNELLVECYKRTKEAIEFIP